ncbi:MAG: GDP-L-fucose synthase [Methanoregula sp.]|jgi:GDP-L-fucose synthase|uniref:GDP-L-fucose synthase family protein n=1 Tax=Methanoregula sp. TaxID=2052170 RepID=UPI003D0D7DA4
MININKETKIYVAGHRGMVGSAIIRELGKRGYEKILTASHAQLDLCNQRDVNHFFNINKPEVVFIAAARVGGINANRLHPAEFLYENCMIQSNLLHASCEYKTKKVIFLGSSCIYPRECPQPMKEEYLMTGPLEPTNEGYALAKISGVKMAQYYHQQYGMEVLCPIPCNLYGTNDHFNLETAHVLAALVKRFVDAKKNGDSKITLWGTGSARREFLHVDDFSRALMVLLERWGKPDIINVGSGTDISIYDLACKIKNKVGFNGEIIWDTSMPDGMPRKCLDVTNIKNLGFSPIISLEDGIMSMIDQYRAIRSFQGINKEKR